MWLPIVEVLDRLDINSNDNLKDDSKSYCSIVSNLVYIKNKVVELFKGGL